MMNFRQAQSFLQLIYPSRCVSCGVLVEGDFGLCGTCWRETPFVTGLSCDACGVPLMGPDPSEIAHCDACMAAPRPWERGRATLVYEDLARQLVMRLKHGDRTDMARPMAGWKARKAQALVCEDTILVPVPLHWRRLLKRKYNQAALLSGALAKQLDVPHCPDALLRTRATLPLKGDREARLEAIKGAIVLNQKRAARIQGRSVLLVDDVMTSGATLEAAALALAPARPRKIDVITLARVAMNP